MGKLYDPISKAGIIDEMNRICRTTNEVYKNADKIARVNQTLDRYWHLASMAAPKGTFDDVNQTGAPIETQSLVAGTNAYKIGSFTNEVLQILKLSVLEDDGTTEVDLVREEFDDYNEFLHWYSTATADRGNPYAWTKYGDFIYIRPTPDYSETDGLRAYVNRELSKFSFVSFTITIAAPGVITAVAHGLSNGDTVLLMTDGALPTGLTKDATPYYVSGKAADTFKLSSTPALVGSTEITTSGSQSGTHQFVKVSKIPGIPVIHHDYLGRHASLPFLIERKLPQRSDVAQEILRDEEAIQDYWMERGRELRTIIRTKQRSFR